MATRRRRLKHDDDEKRRAQAAQLLERLKTQRQGAVVMTPTQILAAKIVIVKCFPLPQRAKSEDGGDQ